MALLCIIDISINMCYNGLSPNTNERRCDMESSLTPRTKLHAYSLRASGVAAVVLFLFGYIWFEMPRSLTSMDAFIVSYVMMAAGLLVAANTAVEVLIGYRPGEYVGKAMFAAFGAAGFLEGATSAIALHSGDRSYYDLFHPFGLIALVAVVAILPLVQLVRGQGSTH